MFPSYFRQHQLPNVQYKQKFLVGQEEHIDLIRMLKYILLIN
jgi:hypothetical protein